MKIHKDNVVVKKVVEVNEEVVSDVTLIGRAWTWNEQLGGKPVVYFQDEDDVYTGQGKDLTKAVQEAILKAFGNGVGSGQHDIYITICKSDKIITAVADKQRTESANKALDYVFFPKPTFGNSDIPLTKGF